LDIFLWNISKVLESYNKTNTNVEMHHDIDSTDELDLLSLFEITYSSTSMKDGKRQKIDHTASLERDNNAFLDEDKEISEILEDMNPLENPALFAKVSNFPDISLASNRKQNIEYENELDSRPRKLPQWILHEHPVSAPNVSSERQAMRLQRKEHTRSNLLENDNTYEIIPKNASQMIVLEIYPLRKGRIVVFDAESTGFSNNDGIIEIAGVEIIDGVQSGLCFVSRAANEAASCIHPLAFKVHGISSAELQRERPIKEVLRNFLCFLKNIDLLVAHNILFDLRMLRQDLERCQLSLPAMRIFCTQRYFRKWKPGLPYDLDSVSSYLQIPKRTVYRADSRHDALSDTLLCTEVYLQMMRMLPSLESSSIPS